MSPLVAAALCLMLVSSFAGISLAQNQDSAGSGVDSAENTEFNYNAAGRRDPFVPLVQEIIKTKARPKRDMGPLEKFELNQFRLMAMLIVKGSPRAMVKAPDGKSYTVKIGDLIGSNTGIVKRIETKTIAFDEASGQRLEKSPDRIVVEETLVENYTGKILKEERYIEM